jgi:DNA primase
MSSTVEQIKTRLSIVDVVGSYIKLTKAGINFKARCPFHNEKTPSFFVSPERDTYHCFGCGKGGDIFSFIQDIEGLEFYEALKLLGGRAGVSVTFAPQDAKISDEKEKVFTVLQYAKEYYEKNLEEKEDAKKYLLSRGLTPSTIKAFHIGFAKDAWRDLLSHLISKGFSRNEIEKAGLIVLGKKKDTKEEVYYDRFRSRIMFPIENANGKTIGFSGRVFGKESEEAKYINSPQGILFDKSKVLYGYSRAKEGIRKFDFCIFVEGQMDVLLSQQAGFTNTVAVSGTSPSSEHLALVRRFTENLIFAFDRDAAGRVAWIRFAKLALSQGFEIKIAHIIEGKDPADLILLDKEKWKEAIKNAKDFIEYSFNILEEEHSKNKKEMEKTIKGELLPIIASIPDALKQNRYVSLVAQNTTIQEKFIYEELEKIKKENFTKENSGAAKTIQASKERKELILEQLTGIYLWQKKFNEKTIDEKEIMEKIKKLLPEYSFSNFLENVPEDKKSKLAFQAEVWYKDSDNIENSLAELYKNLEIEIVKDHLSQKLLEIKRTEILKDDERTQKLLLECKELSEKLSRLKVN